MLLSSENILLIGSLLLFASIVASKTSYRLGVPTLILFIMIGMLAGSDGFGGIYFDDPKLAQMLGVVALNFILFSGGMDTDIKEAAPVFLRGVSLSTIGVFLTAVSVGAFASAITQLNFLEGLLLGAIVSSTDAAAVFSILRTRNIGLKGSIRQTLELESGSNDPMAYFLTITCIQLILLPDTSIWLLLLNFLQQMAVGAVGGYLMGKAMIYLINRIRLDVDGLYPVLVLALMFFTFSMTDLLGGNGFLAVYLSGILLGNSEFVHKRSLIRFYDGQAWLMQIIMFLTLGLLVFPSQVLPLAGIGLLLSLFLIFVSRPLGVLASLSFFRIKLRNRLFISWVGLRGAVPIVFATYPLLAGLEHAQFIFNLVFFISLSSVVMQGTTLPLVAKWLHVIVPSEVRKKSALEAIQRPQKLQVLFDIVVTPESPLVNRPLLKVKFPNNAFITVVKRNNAFFTPDGNSVILPNDHLYIVCRSEEDRIIIEQMI